LAQAFWLTHCRTVGVRLFLVLALGLSSRRVKPVTTV